MKKWLIIVLVTTLCIAAGSCFNTKKEPAALQVVTLYKTNIDNLVDQVERLSELAAKTTSTKELQAQFARARHAYKQVEWLAEYYQPFTARFINGPALQEVEAENKEIVIEPEGFQVIEQFLYPAYAPADKDELLQQLALLKSNLFRLQKTALSLETTDAHIFDALRLQVFRVISLGISGFDSPIALNSIPEAGAAIKSIRSVLSIYRYDSGSPALDSVLASTLLFLAGQKDFVSADRMKLITAYLNPLSEQLWHFQNNLGISSFTEPRALKANAKHFFAAGIFNPDFYAPDASAVSSPEKIALGKKLFNDPVLSVNCSRTCASCHQSDKAFTDGLKTNTNVNGLAPLQRNTPTLLNSALQPALFYDTRVSFLEDQAKAVIQNKDEMHGSLQEAVRLLQQDKEYGRRFVSAFNEPVISERQIKNAIAAYVRSLVALNSRFDQYMRGDATAMNKTEINGFNLFMGKAKCGTCHFAPLFNGNNPPNFLKIDAEIIGVPASNDTVDARLDQDLGKFYVHNINLYRFAFKTPTVRNSELTAPYMHNGVFNTLEEVVDFYDRGGGLGLHLNIPGQTLPADRLNLTPLEKKEIIAFLKTLNDTGY